MYDALIGRALVLTITGKLTPEQAADSVVSVFSSSTAQPYNASGNARSQRAFKVAGCSASYLGFDQGGYDCARSGEAAAIWPNREQLESTMFPIGLDG